MAEDSFQIGAAWRKCCDSWQLGENKVHLFLTVLAVAPERAHALSAVLAPEERERSARFKFEKDQIQYSVARATLRQILAKFLATDPRALTFEYNAYGKPLLGEQFANSKIEFNQAHSKGLGLFAVTLNRAIGVDIECHRPDLATMEIAERFFAPQEIQVLGAVAPAHRIEAFFQCWTRKEAFIKARGMGLSLGLDKFTVAFGPGSEARLLTVDPGATDVANWALCDASPARGYSGALAIETKAPAVHKWTFTPES